MATISKGEMSSMGNGVSMDGKPPDGGSDKVSKISFRDKVLGSKQPPPLREKVDLLRTKLAHWSMWEEII